MVMAVLNKPLLEQQTDQNPLDSFLLTAYFHFEGTFFEFLLVFAHTAEVPLYLCQISNAILL